MKIMLILILVGCGVHVSSGESTPIKIENAKTVAPDILKVLEQYLRILVSGDSKDLESLIAPDYFGYYKDKQSRLKRIESWKNLEVSMDISVKKYEELKDIFYVFKDGRTGPKGLTGDFYKIDADLTVQVKGKGRQKSDYTFVFKKYPEGELLVICEDLITKNLISGKLANELLSKLRGNSSDVRIFSEDKEFGLREAIEKKTVLKNVFSEKDKVESVETFSFEMMGPEMAQAKYLMGVTTNITSDKKKWITITIDFAEGKYILVGSEIVPKPPGLP